MRDELPVRENVKTVNRKTKRFRISIPWDKVTDNATFATIVGTILMALLSIFVLNKQNTGPIILAPVLTVEVVAPTPEFRNEGGVEIRASRVMTTTPLSTMPISTPSPPISRGPSPSPTLKHNLLPVLWKKSGRLISTLTPIPAWTPPLRVIPSPSPNVPQNGFYGETKIRGLKILAAARPGSSEVYLTFVNPLSDTTFEGILLTDERWFLVTDDLGNQYPPDPFSLGLKGHVTVGPSAHISRTVGLETSIAQNAGKLRILLRHVTAKKQGELYSDFLPDIVVVLKPRGEEP